MTLHIALSWSSCRVSIEKPAHTNLGGARLLPLSVQGSEALLLNRCMWGHQICKLLRRCSVWSTICRGFSFARVFFVCWSYFQRLLLLLAVDRTEGRDCKGIFNLRSKILYHCQQQFFWWILQVAFSKHPRSIFWHQSFLEITFIQFAADKGVFSRWQICAKYSTNVSRPDLQWLPGTAVSTPLADHNQPICKQNTSKKETVDRDVW